MIERFVTHILAMLAAMACCISAYEIAKAGCPDACGGVKIPFPFGIGNDCYMNTDHLTYRIRCDHSTYPPVPLLFTKTTQTHEVMSINLEDHSIRISSRVAYECYENGEPNPSTAINSNYTLQNLQPFSLSATRNKLVAIGCDTTARVGELGSSGKIYDATGCMAFCYSSDQFMRNGTCSGVGCCETSIVMINTTVDHQFSIFVGSLNNHSDVVYYNPCNYAFVVEMDSFNFSIANLTSTASDCDKIRVPVVYDWAVTLSESCSQAKKAGNGSPLSLCGSNTQRVDGFNGGCGYRCECLKGYTGNPYLGCLDVDECVDEQLNDCEKQEYCVNKNGGYVCQGPQGLPGNGVTTSPSNITNPLSALTSPIANGFRIGTGLIVAFYIVNRTYTVVHKRKEKKEREHNFKKNGGLLLQQEMSANESCIDKTKIFSRSELEKATDSFNNNRVLGMGGQGTVYKGMLEDGTIVAVKKSRKVDENQLAHFINEVVILSQINHRNIVKLLGCCLETQVPLLVYEFVPNDTLYRHVHHPTEDFQMTWKVRSQIALECAGAIAYLHSSCSSPIYHRDIKSSNILLDSKYRAKISDFGTSKTISIDKTHVTTCVQGTFGYLDPEFFRSSQFSEKSDVYSFGVVLLELLTSKKPIVTNTGREARGLAVMFLQLMETTPNELNGMLDTQVSQNCSKQEIEALAKLIKRCLSLNGKQRPTMREVAMTLEMIKSQDYKEGDHETEQEMRGRVDHLGSDRIGITNEESSATNTSSYDDNSYSINLQPFSFGSH